jgi:hypothetical protein
MMAKPRIELADIIEDAEFAFWAEVVKHLPVAQSGDFDPISSLRFDLAITEAIRTWWGWNASMHYDLQLPDGEILEGGDTTKICT